MRWRAKIYTFLIAVVGSLLFSDSSFAMSGGEVQQQLREPQNRRGKTFIHTVEKGESLSSILKKYKVSLDKFLKTNKRFAVSDFKLSLGDQLVFKTKDLNSAEEIDIARQIKAYLNEWGVSQQKDTPLPARKVEKIVPRKSDADKINVGENLPKYERVKESNRRLNDEFSNVKADREIEGAQNDIITTYDDGLNVALLLPINRSGEIDKDYEAFYKGVLLAMDSLRRNGNIIHLELIDTGRDMEVVNALVANNDLRDKNIIFGPVFNDQFSAVADYARRRRIAVVSPLAAVKAANPYVFQVAPEPQNRYDKLKNVVNTTKNVVFFTSSSDDDVFMKKMREFAEKPDETNFMRYYPDINEEVISKQLSTDVENVIVVGAKNKAEIEIMVSKIFAVKSKYGAKYSIRIVGSPEFNKIDDNKRIEFFRTSVCYIASYHQDRLNSRSKAFESAYVDMFNELPNLFSYRGYDVAMFFINLMSEYGDEFIAYSEDNLRQVLQVNYNFHKEEVTGKNINREWMLVNYKPNFTIEAR